MLGNILSAGALIFLVVVLIRHLHELPRVELSFTTISIAITSVAVFCIGTVCLAYAWMILLRGSGGTTSLRRSYVLIGKSQIAKYLPGNIFHFVGRVALGAAEGIPAEAVVLSMGVETVTLAVTAAIISAVGLSLGGVRLIWLESLLAGRLQVYVVLIIVAAILILSVVALGVRRVRLWIVQRAAYLHPRRVVLAMLIYACVFLVDGVAIFWLVSGFLGIETTIRWYEFAWGFSLAWLVGFVMPGAPGGIGIREAVLVGLFGGELGEGLAVGLAAMLRIATTAGDLLTFLTAFFLETP